MSYLKPCPHDRDPQKPCQIYRIATSYKRWQHAGQSVRTMARGLLRDAAFCLGGAAVFSLVGATIQSPIRMLIAAFLLLWLSVCLTDVKEKNP